MKKAYRSCICAVLSMLAVLLCLQGCSEAESGGLTAQESGGQIIISEVMSSNSVFYPAADGRCYDWVELRNLTGHSYDLSGCFLTDNERDPQKCRLTGVTLEPYGYAVIYLSGLSGVDVEGRLHASFKLSSMGETIYLNDVDGVVMSSMTIPESPENVSFGYPAMVPEYTDNFLSWFATPTPGAENGDDYAADPSQLTYSTNGVVISEYMIDNSFTVYDADGDYPDWVELHNPTAADADMSGYMLTDDPEAIGKWRFPDGTVIPAGGYLTVFCSGKDKTDTGGALHTSFSLSREETTIVLSSRQGVLVSQAPIYNVPENISCGVHSETGDWKLFARSTPGAANSTAWFELDDLPAPDINDGVLISEALAASSASSDYTTDYIEIYNATSAAVQLGGYTLAQTPGEVVFTFPEMTLRAGGYLLVWCDGTTADSAGSKLRAPIKLNVGGETIYLANSEGRVVDRFDTGRQVYGVSSGRSGSDTSVRRFFTSPTPGAANSGTWYAAYAPQPVFSRLGGYVEAGTQVTISVPEGCTVRYTTDGTEPDGNSPVYSAENPITIDKTTVLKAKSYMEGCLAGEMTAATYFVEQPHSIPVVSMSGFGLTDFYNGILITGYYNNYRQGWVRDVHVEYYDEKGALGVEFNAGAEIFGQYSRSLDKKGIRLNVSEKYGCSEVTYPFFTESVTGVSTFKSLLLRPSGQDQTRTMVRDEIVPAIIRGRVEVDYQEYLPCALYVNGEYWGLYYIRERLDEDYLVSKYGYEKGKTDLIKSQLFEQAGTIDAYAELESYARSHDLTNQKHYEHMKELIDFESLCDFWIIETYFCNTDTGNIRCYRTEGGKWRWMVYDFDWAMTKSTYRRDYIYRHCLERSGHGSANFSNVIIRKLLANEEFRDLFISRYCYHLNNTFEPDRCIAILDSMTAAIRDEVPRNAEKWPEPSAEAWEDNIEFLKTFFTVKPDMAKDQLKSNFGLSDAQLSEYLKNNK